MISVIIPFYNEAKLLSEKSQFFKGLSAQAEVVFVDGGSSDRSVEIARNYGKVISCEKGRAQQMNHGAQAAGNDILLFLHADNFIDLKTLASVENKLQNSDFIAGCLTQRIDKEGRIYRLIEGQGNRRAEKNNIFYGDQGIFIKKSIFFQLSGYPDVPIMEDVLFSKQLRVAGKVIVLPDKILVSARRWEKKGIVRTVILYNLLILLFHLKVPLRIIRKLYDDLR